LGSVFFNLAENRDDRDRPFAFLATYAVHAEATGKLQHIPLGRVVRDEAQKGSRDQLVKILEPLEKLAQDCPWVGDLLGSRKIFQPQGWTPSEAYRLLQDIPLCEKTGVQVRVPDWWSGGKRARPHIKLEVGQGTPSRIGAHGLVDFKLSVALGEDGLTDEEWQTLLSHASGLVKIRGRWVEVDGERLARVHKAWSRALAMHRDGGIPFGAAMRFLIGARPPLSPQEGEPQGILLPDDFHRWSQVSAGAWLKEALQGLRQPEIIGQHSGDEPGIRAQLRPYQVVGLNWLWHIYGLKLGGCLADDMGLGKTLQILALLTRIKRVVRPKEPSLLVVPASLLGNWQAEAARFAPGLQCRVAHKSFPEGTRPFDEDAPPDIVLTSYGHATRLGWLAEKSWDLVILDEAQAIKNPSTQQTLAIKQLRSHCRIALTGTPIENRLSDLWSLFDFACPGLLGTQGEFRELCAQERGLSGGADDAAADATEPLSAIRRLVAPYILRRLKTDKKIIQDLPPKTEMLVWCGLTPKQAALYAAEVEQLKQELENLEKASKEKEQSSSEDTSLDEKRAMRRRGVILGYLTRFKQICNHPAHAMGIGHFTLADSGKWQRLKELAQEIHENQEKVLVFTQFQAITGALASLLSEVFGRDGLILTGSTPVSKRKDLVAAFQAKDGPPFFVLSLKAGGTGLNLTAASHVIHFDRWWNPAVENQATDRAFRIGQDKRVLVHKFVCRGTIEDKISRMIADKTALATKILSMDKDQKSGGLNLTEMSDSELLNLVALDIRSSRLLDE
jgi:non-specific serine/threonine protein kinase